MQATNTGIGSCLSEAVLGGCQDVHIVAMCDEPTAELIGPDTEQKWHESNSQLQKCMK